jgi:hypothetical protein
MSEVTTAPAETAKSRWRGGLLLGALIPLLLLGGLIAVLVITGAGLGDRTAPPIEALTIDRITLPMANQIVVTVTNGGADPVTVAQVQVDDAYWKFTMAPDRTIPRLGSATITLPYPWVQDEAHIVKLVSGNGTTFEHEIAVATRTPGVTLKTIGRYALLGIYVGFIPVSLGLMWFPFLRRLGRGGMQAVLSLTIGLLVFLLVDTVAEAMEIVGQAAPVFGGGPLVLIVALLSCGALMALGGGTGKPATRLSVSYRIALGIGLHNLGEGLAIGAAFALGSAALGTFLVIGFTLHNITEGIGIAAPIAREKPAFWHFVGLAALAGLPAVAGVWIGGFVYSNLLTAIFLAMGAGAIAQVIYEVGRLIQRQSSADKTPLLSKAVFGGFVAGVFVMYATALLVST